MKCVIIKKLKWGLFLYVLLVLFFSISGFSMNTKHSKDIPLTALNIQTVNNRCYNVKTENWNYFSFPQVIQGWIIGHCQHEAGNHALDIGSGTGMLASWLKEKGFSVTCIDPAEEMVRRCRKKGLLTIKTTIQDFSTEQKFGLITAVRSLIHVSKKELPSQLDKIANWLNPQGIFILVMISGQGEGWGETQDPFPRFFNYYTVSELHTLLQKNFKIITEQEVGSPIINILMLLQKQ